jgi:hypothetical protein
MGGQWGNKDFQMRVLQLTTTKVAFLQQKGLDGLATMVKAKDDAIYEEMKGSTNTFTWEMVPTSPYINIEILAQVNDQLIGDSNGESYFDEKTQ